MIGSGEIVTAMASGRMAPIAPFIFPLWFERATPNPLRKKPATKMRP
jgi:hypothetical protein